MPRPARSYRVLHDFTFVPRPSVVQVFRAGATLRGPTRACVAAGLAEGALELITATKESNHGETDHL